jgi:hypothetical protein
MYHKFQQKSKAVSMNKILPLWISFLAGVEKKFNQLVIIRFFDRLILYIFIRFVQIITVWMINLRNIRIAVDFDGTIVDHEYPGIGKEKLFAFQTLKEIEKLGARLILWTFRSGEQLEEAVEFCKKNGIEFYAVNKNYPEEVFDETVSRKIDADIYIDDKNLGGFPGWSEVWQILVPYELHQKEMEKQIAAARKNSIMKFFGKKNKQDEN